MEAELAEIDENIVRHDIDPIDMGDLLLHRKEIYEAIYPETKQPNQGGAFRGNQHKKEVTDSGSLTTPKSFIQDTAEKMGVDPATISRKIQTAKNLTPEVKHIVKENKIGTHNALKLSRIKEPEKQKEVAEKLARHEIKTVDEALPRVVTVV